MSPSVAVVPVARRPAQQPQDPETFDVTIRKLKLVGALKKGGIDVDITQVISDGKVEDSTTGAPQVTVDLLDRDLGALQSGVFGQKVDITLDGVPYRLVEVSLTGVETLELLFEHKLVNLLREHRSALKASRSSVTRAQFIEMMLREVAPEFPIRYVCPEINKVQAIQGAKVSGRSLTAKTLGGATVRGVKGSDFGFGLTHLDITYWDGSTVTLGPSQLKNAALVLQVAKQLGASQKATLAILAACIVEPAKPFENTKAGPQGAGILSWVGKPWANDVATAVQNALQDPGATGAGGMISLAQRHPGWTPGQVAQTEQGSAFPARYDQAVAGAQQVLNAFTSGGGYAATGLVFGGASGSGYEFSRGQPGQPEDSWSCILRLAREVNWRAFVAGRNSFYFVTDDDLLVAQSVYTITPNTVGLVDPGLTFGAEVGGRTVRKHRHRQPKPSEASLTVRIDRWSAPPGSVITLDGWGPGDGRWLIIDTTRPLFDTEATVNLQSPQAPFAEPSSSSAGSLSSMVGLQTGVIAGGAVDQVYAASQQMDSRNLPYIWGGGHTGNWQTAAQASGYDCSGAVSMVLYQGGLMSGYPGPIVSGDFANWGQPGRGSQMTVWYSNIHVFIEFYGRPAKRFDTVPGGSGGQGPHLRYTAPGDAGDTWEASGFTPRRYPGL